MIIVIDGYNLLKQLIKTDYATQMQRQWFITSMSHYGHARKHTLIIVFDGGQYKWPTWVKKGQVSVVYSGVQTSADDYIKEYIEQNSQRGLLIVSSDRAVTNFAFRFTVPSIDALAFFALVQERMQTPVVHQATTKATAYKTSSDATANPELDALMQSTDTRAIYKEDTHAEGKTRAQKKDSKEEKQLFKVLKKI
ncbi:NYN domain-containing protein [Candidatus Dependentiae bacterium]|nr:NYN domain-containing protein [Candidatus Dependentiae bacterium]